MSCVHYYVHYTLHRVKTFYYVVYQVQRSTYTNYYYVEWNAHKLLFFILAGFFTDNILFHFEKSKR